MPPPAILMVDDDAAVLTVGRLMLRKAGHRVVTAGTGDEAIAVMRRDEVALVFLDLTMPGKSGVETFRALRAVKPEVRVVIVSGHDDLRASGEFSDVGDPPSGYLQKPFTMVSLTAAAQKYFPG